MPIYEYICTACEHSHDALQKISEAPLTDCPNCGEPELKKQISSPNFRLSGSGWYETDFKSGNKRNIADKGADKGGEKKPEKSTDKGDKSKSAPAASCGTGACPASS